LRRPPTPPSDGPGAAEAGRHGDPVALRAAPPRSDRPLKRRTNLRRSGGCLDVGEIRECMAVDAVKREPVSEFPAFRGGATRRCPSSLIQFEVRSGPTRGPEHEA
jgi:hypothetical protein